MMGGAHLGWGCSRSKIMSKLSLTASLDCHTSYFYHSHVSPSTQEFPLMNSQKKKRQEWSQMHQSAGLVPLEMDCCYIIAPFVGDLERWSDKMTLNSLLDQPRACTTGQWTEWPGYQGWRTCMVLMTRALVIMASWATATSEWPVC